MASLFLIPQNKNRLLSLSYPPSISRCYTQDPTQPPPSSLGSGDRSRLPAPLSSSVIHTQPPLFLDNKTDHHHHPRVVVSDGVWRQPPPPSGGGANTGTERERDTRERAAELGGGATATTTVMVVRQATGTGSRLVRLT
ncbi:hypothetical protein Hdeb2414_s0004g00136021 [Helianthus debilis subsp. tardiflorus]